MTGLADALRRARPVEGWGVRPAIDSNLSAWAMGLANDAGATDSPSNSFYDALVGYFAAGVWRYRSTGCAQVLYPGLPGTRGTRVEGLEGFTRSGVLLAAYARTRSPVLSLADGSTLDLHEHLIQGLSNGTDPASPEYWGEFHDYDQRIIEAADIALIVWLQRERIERELSAKQRRNLVSWLLGVFGKSLYGGNWLLSPLTVSAVCRSMGWVVDARSPVDFDAIRSMHLGNGWFSETHSGRVDLYSAWQMNYLLPLVESIDPGVTKGFPLDCLAAFGTGYLHMFSPNGFPLFGRSQHYRLAVPAPLLLQLAMVPGSIDPSQVRRALDVVWTHYVSRGALFSGTVSQGIYSTEPALLENYAGRASALWSLRSLVAAYMQPNTAPLWMCQPSPLPVERSSYHLRINGPRLNVYGDVESRRTCVAHDENEANPSYPLTPHGRLRRLAEAMLHRPLRPDNYVAKYFRPRYCS